jgi:hypothetical protein
VSQGVSSGIDSFSGSSLPVLDTWARLTRDFFSLHQDRTIPSVIFLSASCSDSHPRFFCPSVSHSVSPGQILRQLFLFRVFFLRAKDLPASFSYSPL